MSDQKTILRTSADRERFIAHLIGMSLEHPLEIKWKKYSPTRSLSANALYWVWMDTLAQSFNERELKQAGTTPDHKPQSYDKDDMHNLSRHFWLGYETIKIRNTVIDGQLKSTAKLNRAEFCAYMEKVNAWAVHIKIVLPFPAESDYARYLEQNG